jgi:hypothetical protein
MTRYKYAACMAFLPTQHGGKSLPQVYCVSLGPRKSTDQEARVMFTDDVIFAPHKKALFQLVVLINDTRDIAPAMNLGFMSTVSRDLIVSEEATIIVEDPTASMSHAPDLNGGQSIFRVASANEFAMSVLCADRPAPRYYDEMRIGKDIPGARFLVVRKDRFIFDACKSLEELETIVNRLSTVLGIDS